MKIKLTFLFIAFLLCGAMWSQKTISDSIIKMIHSDSCALERELDETITEWKKEDNINDESRTICVLYLETSPTFPGGEQAMLKFIADSLNYPSSAYKRGIEGRVVVRFVIDETGEITDITLLRGIDEECDAEVIRVVERMPRWEPGKLNGIKVPVYFNLPITFRLNPNSEDQTR